MKKIDRKWWGVLLAGSLLASPINLYAGDAPRCLNDSSKVLNREADLYHTAIKKAANRYSVSPALIKAVIATGSCFEHSQVSPEGRIGLMQLMPNTAKRFGAMDVFDPEANIDAGTRYLSYLLRRYQGSLAEVFAAYAADRGTVWQDTTPQTPFAQIQEPVKQLLTMLLKFESNKKANRQAQTLVKQWSKNPQDYQTALLALPQPDTKVAKTWFKSRLAAVHYPRTPEARGCGGFSAKTLQAKAAPYETIIQQAAKRHGVNPALVKSVIAAESCYREMVVSYKGASGLMQLMPETAAELGVLDIFDPQENINAGTRYLSWLLKRYNGSATHAIAAYNAGAGRIPQGEPVTISFTETRGYIRNVLTNLTKLEKGKQPIAHAQFLLAGWEQADLEYRAALRGETLTVAQTDQAPVATDSLQPNNLATPTLEPTPDMAATVVPNEQISLAAMPTDTPPNVQLISAIDQGIVRVKHINTVAILPADNPATPEHETMDIIAPVEFIPSNEPAPQLQPSAPALPNCDVLPPALFSQTEQRGSGRYAAFFYPVQTDETLQQIVVKLGISPEEVTRLNKIPDTGILNPGSQLKVAECTRSL
ncbi:MAG: transglycosylase SLT domain-containing protein [Candidatus Thiothrix putei]|uniref:Transglycosylase SLT domain-containing protein n=1 Tax=Candidatus Thiothrix putei TaxID=3080811 RepID=A0AA95HEE9_9GAMM|nr:MAG: transglycosylase SLT domain-containing protein [Candidatus Thiothrix putei]